MKMKAEDVLNAGLTLAAILNRRPKVPQQANYRLARMYKAVKPEADIVDEQRVAIVMELGQEVLDKDGKPTGAWRVPERGEDGKETPAILQYRERWKALGATEIEIHAEPISVTILGDEGLDAIEIANLGPLIVD